MELYLFIFFAWILGLAVVCMIVNHKINEDLRNIRAMQDELRTELEEKYKDSLNRMNDILEHDAQTLKICSDVINKDEQILGEIQKLIKL